MLDKISNIMGNDTFSIVLNWIALILLFIVAMSDLLNKLGI